MPKIIPEKTRLRITGKTMSSGGISCTLLEYMSNSGITDKIKKCKFNKLLFMLLKLKTIISNY
tara:strand:- start:350 stop:538 length:189 start_codon:yes stop_codon:yes gene_type:complete